MKLVKTLLIVLFIIGMQSALAAETVALFFREVSANQTKSHESELKLAVESGIMEVFFDAGHIAFPVTAEGIDPPFRSEPREIRQAKSGGASWLLDIQLRSDIELTLIDLLGNELVLSREILGGDSEGKGGTIGLESGVAVGRTIAEFVLGLLN